MAITGFTPAIVSLLTHPLFFRLPNMASQNIFANIQHRRACLVRTYLIKIQLFDTGDNETN